MISQHCLVSFWRRAKQYHETSGSRIFQAISLTFLTTFSVAVLLPKTTTVHQKRSLTSQPTKQRFWFTLHPGFLPFLLINFNKRFLNSQQCVHCLPCKLSIFDLVFCASCHSIVNSSFVVTFCTSLTPLYSALLSN